MSIDEVKKWLGTYADMLNLEETSDYITMRPRQYLGSENFAKIAATVRQHGGEYISAGKESHFRVARASGPATVTGVLYCPHCGKAVKLEKA